MDKDNLVKFFESLQEHFLESRFDALDDYVVLPLVIYSVAGVTLVRSKEELERISSQYRDALDVVGVQTSDTKIVHIDEPKNQRMRTTVSFTDYDVDGTPVTGSVVRYFLVMQDDRFKIEMMEYLQEPLAANVVEQIVH